MGGGASKSARALAAEVLRRFDGDRVTTNLSHMLDQTQERQRATDLVYGTIRNLHAIDAVIVHFSGRRIERIAPNLRSILRVAVYELAYSPATPTYSIVNEAVNAARTVGGKKQTGFVNAVLRGIGRRIVDRQADPSGAQPARTLVRTPTAGCTFDTDFLPDPDSQPIEYLSACFSLPAWLVAEWIAEFGPEQTRAICLASNRRPSLYLRPNPLRTDAQSLLEEFEQAGFQAEVTPTSMLKVTSPHAVTQLPGFAEGLFAVQDLAAAAAVRRLDPQPDWTILDLCAAPGTKTTQLAEQTNDAAQIVATDIDGKRLERVKESIARLGLRSISVVPYDQLEQQAPGPYDAVLVDAPCSNTGVLAKRVEVRHRIRPGVVADLATTQRELLEKAAGLVKPGGRLCYSTCSIQKAENQEVVGAFCADHEQFTLAHEELTLPSAQTFDHDGAYVACLKQG